MAKGHSVAAQDPAETGFMVVNKAGSQMTPAVASAVREAAACYGLSPAADELREACDALLRRVAASPDDPERGHFEVTINHRPGRIVVQIDDHGAPYELADDAASDRRPRFTRRRSCSTSCTNGSIGSTTATGDARGTGSS